MRFQRYLVPLAVVLALAACSPPGETQPSQTREGATPDLSMVTILGPGDTATFVMGSTDEELAAQETSWRDSDYTTDDEQPAREVTLTIPYEIGRYEVTNEEYARVMNWAI
ncbi:MAG: SUMF1/EgtB/PvdO family nonheme iron enzyme, partial [Demequinaceae bacterium]|nr:SUMF1/EgtB/PvdO family nonheme iron enzyme [Demequinaceae bacterium]